MNYANDKLFQNSSAKFIEIHGSSLIDDYPILYPTSPYKIQNGYYK